MAPVWKKAKEIGGLLSHEIRALERVIGTEDGAKWFVNEVTVDIMKEGNFEYDAALIIFSC
jgi:hypothetical protein